MDLPWFTTQYMAILNHQLKGIIMINQRIQRI